MTNKTKIHYCFAVVFVVAGLVLTVAAVSARNPTLMTQTLVAEGDPDFLVLNPERE